VLEPSFIEAYVNTNRWFTTLVHQPEFTAVIGDFQFCTKMAQFDAKKFQELQGAAGKAGKGGKKEGGKQKEKAPKQEKPKKEEKTPEPEATAVEEAPKKPKDPFALMPAGNLNMDEWKKTYQNNETSVSLPWFWEKFDKENYSIWYCEYQYADELSLMFMSCNLVSGMYQRLDRMRKHAFGSMFVCGKDHDTTITGVWVWRGKDLAFELSEDLQIDYSSYSWKKLDPDTEETKKMVKLYFEGSEEFLDGKEIKYVKTFL